MQVGVLDRSSGGDCAHATSHAQHLACRLLHARCTAWGKGLLGHLYSKGMMPPRGVPSAGCEGTLAVGMQSSSGMQR